MQQYASYTEIVDFYPYYSCLYYWNICLFFWIGCLIYDLVILTESDLSLFPTITPEDIMRISQALRMIDLSLGMKLRLDPSDGLYYVEE